MSQKNRTEIITGIELTEEEGEEYDYLTRLELEDEEAHQEDIKKISEWTLYILAFLVGVLFLLLSGCSSNNEPFDFRFELGVKSIRTTSVPEECIYTFHNGQKILAPCNAFDVYHVVMPKTIRIDKTLIHPNQKLLNEPSSGGKPKDTIN